MSKVYRVSYKVMTNINNLIHTAEIKSWKNEENIVSPTAVLPTTVRLL